MLKRILVAAACALLLGACGPGGEIDATNGDTLRDSLNRIVEDMPEVERQRFGQDILLVVEYQAEDIEGLGRNDLFRANYTDLFMSDDETGIFSAFAVAAFEQIALQAGSALDGKSPAQLARDADEIRAAYLENLIVQILAVNAELQPLLDEIPARVTEHEALHAETLARVEELRRQRDSAVSNVRIVSFGYDGRYLVLEALADITNYHSEPATAVNFTLTLPLPDIEGHVLARQHTIRPEEPIPVGEILQDVSLNDRVSPFGGLRRMQGAERLQGSLPIGDIDPGRPSIEFRSYQRGSFGMVSAASGLTPTREQNGIVDGLGARLEACESKRSELEEAIAANAAFAEELRSLIPAPAPFDGAYNDPRRRFGFGRNC